VIREDRHSVVGPRAALSRLAAADGVWPAGPASAEVLNDLAAQVGF
jgi:hypothetical protein